MTQRPEYADLEVGETALIDGQAMIHMGGGRFQPATIGEPLVKRFNVNEGESLHRLVAA